MKLKIASCLSRPRCYITLPQDTAREGLGRESQSLERAPLLLSSFALAPGKPRVHSWGRRPRPQDNGIHRIPGKISSRARTDSGKLLPSDYFVLGTGISPLPALSYLKAQR